MSRAKDLHRPFYYEKSRGAARHKMLQQARVWGITLDIESLRLVAIDDRWYNPAKYMWWEADVIDTNGRTDIFPPGQEPILREMTQTTWFGHGRAF